jgi:O-antigen/teichoic acid export membrane protein
LTSLAGRGVGVIVSLISIPLTITYLGSERYGVWVTISTFLAWLNIADLGLGNGLTNALSESYGQNRSDTAQHYVATAFWMLVGVTLVLGSILALVWPWLDWPALFNVYSPEARAEVAPAIAMAIALALLSFPLSLVAKIYGAYQEGAIANFWAVIGNIVSLLALIVATQVEGGLIWLVVAVSGSVFCATALNAAWLFFLHKPWLAPRFSAIQREHMRRLANTGGMFFVLQVASLLILQTDNLIIAHYLGASQVTPYSVAWRLFSYTTLFQTLLFPSLWPAYTEAFTRKDVNWVRKTFRTNMLYSTMLTIVMALPLMLFGNQIIVFWAGPEAEPPHMLLVWMGCWSIIHVMMSVVACILNGSGHVQGQMIYGMLTAIVNIILSITFVVPFGITGVIAATVIAYMICNVVPAFVETLFVLRKLSSEQPYAF